EVVDVLSVPELFERGPGHELAVAPGRIIVPVPAVGCGSELVEGAHRIDSAGEESVRLLVGQMPSTEVMEMTRMELGLPERFACRSGGEQAVGVGDPDPVAVRLLERPVNHGPLVGRELGRNPDLPHGDMTRVTGDDREVI